MTEHAVEWFGHALKLGYVTFLVLALWAALAAAVLLACHATRRVLHYTVGTAAMVETATICLRDGKARPWLRRWLGNRSGQEQ